MTDELVQPNDHMVLICGDSSTGKSAALRNMSNTIVFNCEGGKRLPFRTSTEQRMKSINITDPMQLPALFDQVAANPAVENIVIDGLNFLMDMYESQYVLTAMDTQKAWGEYAQYFKRFMQEHVAVTKKNVIFTAHIKEIVNKKTLATRIMVPVKGSLLNQGVEAFFTTIVYTKKVRLTDLREYENSMLQFSEEDEMLGYKHVFQTRTTADTTDERVRSPMGMFTIKETFIDNDVVPLFKHMHKYYQE